MRRALHRVIVVVVAFLALSPVRLSPQTAGDEELLRTREKVWRAWFAGNIRTLNELVPTETIVMSGGEKEWKHRSDVLKSSDEFHSKGGKLLRLEFPRTEVQHFDNVAIVWSSYTLETEMDGKISLASSRVTEIFVCKHGRWTNPCWHSDEEK